MTFEHMVRRALKASERPGPHARPRLENWDETADWLTARALNCLRAAGFQSLHELKGFEPGDVFKGMMAWPNSGKKTATEVAQLVAQLRAVPPPPRSVSHWGMFE